MLARAIFIFSPLLGGDASASVKFDEIDWAELAKLPGHQCVNIEDFGPVSVEMLIQQRKIMGGSSSSPLVQVPEFEDYLAGFLSEFEKSNIAASKLGLYSQFKAIEERHRDEVTNDVIVTYLGKECVDTVKVRGREDFPDVSRYQVSGFENNCFFNCSSLMFSQFRGRGVLPTRKECIDYIRENIEDKTVLLYLNRARQGRDRYVSGAENAEDYLDGYLNTSLCIQALANVEQRDTQYESAGIPIAVAYLGKFNLKIYQDSLYEGTQLVVDYLHPEGVDRTLTVLLKSGHYTILAMPGDSKETIKRMEAIERENYYFNWCLDYGLDPQKSSFLGDSGICSPVEDAFEKLYMSALQNSCWVSEFSKQDVAKGVLQKWEAHLGEFVGSKKSCVFAKNNKGNFGFLDPGRGTVYPIFKEDRVGTDCFLPFGYKVNNTDRQIGDFVRSRFSPTTLKYMALHFFGGINNISDGENSPIQSSLIRKEMDNNILDALGLVARTMGAEGLEAYGKAIQRSYKAESQHFQNLSDWLKFFERPSLDLGMHNPIGSFKGNPLRGNHDVPRHIQKSWLKKGFFCWNWNGHLSTYDPRNGLYYPWYWRYYERSPTAMLPRGYKLQEGHRDLGFSFLNAAGSCVEEILAEVLGIPKEAQGALPLLKGKAPLLNSKFQWLCATTGLALSSLNDNSELQGFVGAFLERSVTEDLENAEDRQNGANKVMELL